MMRVKGGKVVYRPSIGVKHAALKIGKQYHIKEIIKNDRYVKLREKGDLLFLRSHFADVVVNVDGSHTEYYGEYDDMINNVMPPEDYRYPEVVVGVKFPRTRFSESAIYHYLCPNPEVEINDYVVVEDMQTDFDFAICQVVSIQSTSKKASKYVIKILDMSEYLAEKEKNERIKTVKKGIDEVLNKAKSFIRKKVERQDIRNQLINFEGGEEYLKSLHNLENELDRLHGVE